jgi:hypothetical protein
MRANNRPKDSDGAVSGQQGEAAARNHGHYAPHHQHAQPHHHVQGGEEDRLRYLHQHQHQHHQPLPTAPDLDPSFRNFSAAPCSGGCLLPNQQQQQQTLKRVLDESQKKAQFMRNCEFYEKQISQQLGRHDLVDGARANADPDRVLRMHIVPLLSTHGLNTLRQLDWPVAVRFRANYGEALLGLPPTSDDPGVHIDFAIGNARLDDRATVLRIQQYILQADRLSRLPDLWRRLAAPLDTHARRYFLLDWRSSLVQQPLPVPVARDRQLQCMVVEAAIDTGDVASLMPFRAAGIETERDSPSLPDRTQQAVLTILE